jgi:xylulokinase
VYLGIDLGTSAVKAVLVDDEQHMLAQSSAPLSVQRPQPLFSEQDPEAWWQATTFALAALKRDHAAELGSVQGIGLSGQMHGATLLDNRDRALRPAILWNDGRSAAECAELERREPHSRHITGNLAMPGFTAPKLLWIKKHEPAVFARVKKVLLPKDWLRLKMSGDYASDLSDSAGTLWLDVGQRAWSAAMLAATELDESAMPRLFEGTQPTGTLLTEVAQTWGVPAGVPIAAGAGDNAAGAVGVGVASPGQAFVSLGTSGVYFVASGHYAANPEGGVHTFCHCLPGAWHQMSVILSAASCLSFLTRLVGADDEAELLAEAETIAPRSEPLLFLPYLSGERTPHNDPNAKGVFFGLTHETRRADLTRAVLEGVAFAFADGQRALSDAHAPIDEVSVIGGGARSALWGRILASALERPLVYRSGGEVGPAFGAARLARLAVTGEAPSTVCTSPAVERVITPDATLSEQYRHKLERYRRLYRELRSSFESTTA